MPDNLYRGERARLAEFDPAPIQESRNPDNPRKGEPEHLHYDFRYLFYATDEAPITEQVGEIGGATWITLEEFSAMGGFSRVAKKVGLLCVQQRERSNLT